MNRHLDILEKQEEMLRFDRFDNSEAWRLGNAMVERANRLGLTVAISIRTADGGAAFQYLPDGTNALNDNWMRRKANTVSLMGHSSLYASYILEKNGESLEDNGLSSEDYALCGGGFPVRLKGTEMVIGAVVASNMYHIADHEFVTGSLREYLKCDEAPEYPYTIPE